MVERYNFKISVNDFIKLTEKLENLVKENSAEEISITDASLREHNIYHLNKSGSTLYIHKKNKSESWGHYLLAVEIYGKIDKHLKKSLFPDLI